ncbi:hypothetical protein SEVIR_9G320450v4 [Setaria viridis]
MWVEEALMLNLLHYVLLSVSHEQPGKCVRTIALHLSLEQRPQHSDQTSVAYLHVCIPRSSSPSYAYWSINLHCKPQSGWSGRHVGRTKLFHPMFQRIYVYISSMHVTAATDKGKWMKMSSSKTCGGNGCSQE